MASSGSEQHLRFRWNDHMQHLSKVLTMQRFEEQFCDVTLVSEDGFVMKAHQAILASTSAYFQRVFSDITSDQHPMVVLRGANFREMSCLLDYMYQGSTQVHQSLMESVLEVADMLEVKGLSQIRSNICIKKFMVPLSSSTAPSTTTTHISSSDSIVEHSKTDDEQSGCHTLPDEQLYRDAQPRTCELENGWMRFSGTCTNETRSTKEVSRTHVEGGVTASEEPPPSSHNTQIVQDSSSNPEGQEESQMSGMDLSMAKNEPWSPKDSTSNQDQNSPSRKRRKLVDDHAICQQRTISFTSITSETDRHQGEETYEEDNNTCSREAQQQHQGDSNAEDSSLNETSISVPYLAQHLTQKASRQNESEIIHHDLQIQMSSLKETPALFCKTAHTSSMLRKILRANKQEDVCWKDKEIPKETRQFDVIKHEQSFCKGYLPGYATLGYGTNQSTDITLKMEDPFESKHFINDSLAPPVICEPEEKPVISPNVIVDGSVPVPHVRTTEVDFLVNKAISITPSIEGSFSCSTQTVQEDVNISSPAAYIVKEKLTTIPTVRRSIDIPTSMVSISSPVQLASCSSLESTSEVPHKIEINDCAESESNDVNDWLEFEPPLSAEDSDGDVLKLLSRGQAVTSFVNENFQNCLLVKEAATPSKSNRDVLELLSRRQAEIPVASFVNVNYQNRLMLKEAVTPPKSNLCLLEEKLTRPKSNVKRPMNPYILFQKEMKKKVMAENPREPYQVTLKRLGFLWRNLSPSEKAKWQDRAEYIKKEHKRLNPDYQYNPYQAYKNRQQYLKARLERNCLYRISSPSEDNAGCSEGPIK